VIWTADADNLLIRLWDEGCSLANVADGMARAGYIVTRSACAGRRHRLSRAAFKRTGGAIKIIRERKLPPPPKRKRSNNMTLTPSRRPLTSAEVAALTSHQGVEYLANTGCKAIMSGRGGPWALPMVCGKRRGYDYNGSPSPYCPTHYRLYTNPQAAKKQHG
jgi:hypothetical protein